MRICVFFLFAFLWVNTASTQEIRLKRTPMLDRLYATKTSISDISEFPNYLTHNNFIIEPRLLQHNKLRIKLIVNDSGLYLVTNSAGFVYKAVKSESDSLLFKAIDSTSYSGYNGNSIKFSYKNVIYSLGGYGFWHTNGYLLHFMPGKDWQIKELNYEVPVLQKLFFIDTQKGKVYYYTPGFQDQITGKLKVLNAFYELDIEKQFNSKMGQINPVFSILANTDIMVHLPLLNGVLVDSRGVLYLIVIADNKVFKLKNQKIKDRFNFEILNTPKTGYIFSTGNNIYFNASIDSKVDSIRFSLADFEELENPLFNREENSFLSFTEWTVFFLGLIILTLFILSKFRRKKISIKIVKSELLQENEFIEKSSFSDFEKLIITTMIQKNKKLNVTEINEILGLKKKTPDFQKKIRTETINRINLKFRSLENVNYDLIQRIKSVEDKRFVLYALVTMDDQDFINKYL